LSKNSIGCVIDVLSHLHGGAAGVKYLTECAVFLTHYK
jgi:hypothetical protein